jgi:HD-GYP domain-containing protein (c-di-GMP phosphodiesterase class II)
MPPSKRAAEQQESVVAMHYIPLSQVRHRVGVGLPLPFNVRDADGTLMLAREQVLESDTQMQALFERGSIVDIAELLNTADQIRHAQPSELPGLWQASMDAMAEALRDARSPTFKGALDEASAPVLALIEREPELAIFQVLRQENRPQLEYGINHSVHTAIITRLVGQRLGWDEISLNTVFKAALTMNLSILELQGTLALQKEPLSDSQRRSVHVHPLSTVHMLEMAGVAQSDWLTAVAQHHELDDGKGYPAGTKAIHEMAQLIGRADRYAAKLSTRSSRDAKRADAAGREIFIEAPNHPMNAALAKEFGIYPPGAFVRLASGETGIVVRRGPKVNTPLVAVLADAAGKTLVEPVTRNTVLAGFAIQSVLTAGEAGLRFDAMQLAELSATA